VPRAAGRHRLTDTGIADAGIVGAVWRGALMARRQVPQAGYNTLYRTSWGF